MWPLFPLLHITGLEVFELPSREVFQFLVVNGVFGSMISDFLWAHCVLLTSPIIAITGTADTLFKFAPVIFDADIVCRPLKYSFRTLFDNPARADFRLCYKRQIIFNLVFSRCVRRAGRISFRQHQAQQAIFRSATILA